MYILSFGGSFIVIITSSISDLEVSIRLCTLQDQYRIVRSQMQIKMLHISETSNKLL